ncbi:MAG: cupredoxin domain-containing protein [Chloroflexota bacterium]
MKRNLGFWGVLFILIAIMLSLLSCNSAYNSPSTSNPAQKSPSTQTSDSPPPNTSPEVNIPSVTLNISASGNAFDKSTLIVQANTRVTLVFDNKDSVPHNVAIYTDSSATNLIFRGDIFSGPKVMNYEFTTPATPGTYFFRCDVHPFMMGSFVVTQ